MIQSHYSANSPHPKINAYKMNTPNMQSKLMYLSALQEA